MSDWGYPRYVSVAEKKAKAEKKLKKLRKKMPDIKPIVIAGRTLAQTWWGKSWNKNLERYADYSNRIGRGRSYVRHGAVLDLKIDPGKVSALVQGSRTKPYEVVINIKAISPAPWQVLKKQSQGQLKSLQDLLSGQFPKTLAEIFFAQENGLFPRPHDISFNCSCPDWASMCKHVAAALYGIGARFDEDPALFFKLRGADTSDLIAQAVKDQTDELLKKSKKKSAKIIDDGDLSDIFGIEMESQPKFSKKKKKPIKDKSAAIKPASANKRAPKPQIKAKTAIGQVAQLILAEKSGLTIVSLVEKTGFMKIKLYGIVHRLKQQGKIKKKAHGVYIKT